MKRRVYIETTVASYLTARRNRDLIVAAHQELTVDWWTNHRQRFDIYVSDIVLREAARGDESAAAKRLAQLEGLAVLAVDDRAGDLARLFVWNFCSPGTAGTSRMPRSCSALKLFLGNSDIACRSFALLSS